MCTVCQAVKKRMRHPMSAAETRAQLDAIAAKIAGGAKPDHFEALMDQLLGTEIQDSDPELDAAWENGRRGRG